MDNGAAQSRDEAEAMLRGYRVGFPSGLTKQLTGIATPADIGRFKVDVLAEHLRARHRGAL